VRSVPAFRPRHSCEMPGQTAQQFGQNAKATVVEILQVAAKAFMASQSGDHCPTINPSNPSARDERAQRQHRSDGREGFVRCCPRTLLSPHLDDGRPVPDFFQALLTQISQRNHPIQIAAGNPGCAHHRPPTDSAKSTGQGKYFFPRA